LKGETVDWRSLYAGKTMRRVPLPGYPFSRTRHWADKRNDTPVAGDAMVASSPGAPKFTNELPDWHADFYQRQPYLQEHKVFNDEVLLGVTYPSLALEAVRANSAIHDANRIQRVVFHSPLSFSADEHARVTIHMKRNGSGGVDFESTHHISGLAGPEKSSSGTISSTDRPATVIDLPPLVRGLSSGYGKQDVYALLRAQGVDYQGSLASVEKVLVGENHAVSMIYASDDLYRNTANYFLHPVWLDAAIVSAKFAFIHDPSALYIPFSVNDVVIYRQPDSRSYCVIKRSLLNEQILKCDVAVCNHLGEVAIDAHGIVCKRILVNTPWKKTRQRMESA
jgi:acyl transferase domain-containing protein